MKYWGRVLARTTTDTFRTLGAQGWPITVIFFVVGALIDLERRGLKAVLEEINVTISFGVVAVAIVATVLWAFNLLATPARMDAERAVELDELSRRLDDREARQAALNKLWELRGDGIGLRNRPCTSDVEFKGWLDEYQAWRNAVLGHAETVSVNLRNWLERLDRTRPSPPDLKFKFDEQRRRARIMSEILLRLEEYLLKELR